MTSQILNEFLYRDEAYRSVAVDGKGLITPQQYGLRRDRLSYNTACHRGFHSKYEITNNGLFLIEMVLISLKEDKPIQGIMPERSIYPNYVGSPTYKGLRLLAPFTGRIRLGKDFIRLEDDVLMQSPNDVNYKILLEFTFDVGKLVSAQDLSASNVKKNYTSKVSWKEV